MSIHHARRAFTIVEVMIALSLLVLLAGVIYATLSDLKPSTHLHASREQVMHLQTALIAWSRDAGSISAARAAFASSPDSDYPDDNAAMLQRLLPYLSQESQTVFYVSSKDRTAITTKSMESAGAYVKLKWAGASWADTDPFVEFFQP
jgi:prepilin-type N-terminal cleavage/methylation domain-containing protein